MHRTGSTCAFVLALACGVLAPAVAPAASHAAHAAAPTAGPADRRHVGVVLSHSPFGSGSVALPGPLFAPELTGLVPVRQQRPFGQGQVFVGPLPRASVHDTAVGAPAAGRSGSASFAPAVASAMSRAAMASPASCKQTLRNTSDVEIDGSVLAAAIVDAAAAGARVHIRIFDKVSGGDLDAAVNAEQSACDSWQNSDGAWADNLLVVAVSVSDEMSGVYYGPAHAPALDYTWRTVQSEMMNPRFQEDEFAEGISDGLVALTDLIVDAKTAPAVSPSGAPDSAGEPAEDDEVPVTPSGGLGLRTILLLVLGGVATVVVGGVGIGATYHARQRKLARAAAQADAKTVRAATQSSRARLEELCATHLVAARLQLARAGSSDDTSISSLVDELTAAKAVADEAFAAAAAMPDPDGALSLGHYQLIEQAFTTAGELTDAANDTGQVLVARLGQTETALTALDAELEQIHALVVQAQQQVAAMTAAGVTDPVTATSLSTCEQALAFARIAYTGGQVRGCQAELDRARAMAQQAIERATILPEQHAVLTAEIDTIVQQVLALRDLVPAFEREVRELDGQFSAADLGDVLQAPAAVAVLLDSAQALVDAARSDASAGPNRWELSRSSLADAAVVLRDAARLVSEAQERPAALHRQAESLRTDLTAQELRLLTLHGLLNEALRAAPATLTVQQAQEAGSRLQQAATLLVAARAALTAAPVDLGGAAGPVRDGIAELDGLDALLTGESAD